MDHAKKSLRTLTSLRKSRASTKEEIIKIEN